MFEGNVKDDLLHCYLLLPQLFSIEEHYTGSTTYGVTSNNINKTYQNIIHANIYYSVNVNKLPRGVSVLIRLPLNSPDPLEKVKPNSTAFDFVPFLFKSSNIQIC
jgi:hypothetical protein